MRWTDIPVLDPPLTAHGVAQCRTLNAQTIDTIQKTAELVLISPVRQPLITSNKMLMFSASSGAGDGDYCLPRSLVQITSSPAGARPQTRSPEGTSGGGITRTRWASICPNRIPVSVIYRANEMSGTSARCLVPPLDSCDWPSCRLHCQILRGSMGVCL